MPISRLDVIIAWQFEIATNGTNRNLLHLSSDIVIAFNLLGIVKILKIITVRSESIYNAQFPGNTLFR